MYVIGHVANLVHKLALYLAQRRVRMAPKQRLGHNITGVNVMRRLLVIVR